jgi:hypothetical protein
VNDDNPPPHSYAKSNSIHHSFQRATTVHGTHHALVQNNVAYHVMGHTYIVEDGDETFNTFDANIDIFTRPHHMMLKSDKQPATFWTAIPTNTWRNNVATDSANRGAWFELEDMGVTLEFKNNTFHHNKGIGFRNYPNYSPPSPQYFHNNTYFKNGSNGLFYKKGGNNHHTNSKFAENGVDLFWKKYKTNGLEDDPGRQGLHLLGRPGRPGDLRAAGRVLVRRRRPLHRLRGRRGHLGLRRLLLASHF